MKKRFSFRKVFLAILLFTVLSNTVIYVWSTVMMNKTYAVPLIPISIPTDAASVQEGERLVRIEHCQDCHGEKFTGRAFHHFDYKFDLVAPNITPIVSTYSDEELERLIRHGVKKNGKSFYFMPSTMYYELKDESIARIIAYLRTLKPLPTTPNLPASSSFYLWGRVKIIQGEVKSVASRINHTAPRQFSHYDTSSVAFGKYLAMTACSNCHGKDLKGGAAGVAPNLVTAGAYTKDQFFHLLQTGEGALGRKNLGLMSIIGKDHLRYLNEQEMSALYAFLKTLPARKE